MKGEINKDGKRLDKDIIKMCRVSKRDAPRTAMSVRRNDVATESALSAKQSEREREEEETKTS